MCAAGENAGECNMPTRVCACVQLLSAKWDLGAAVFIFTTPLCVHLPHNINTIW